MTIYDKYAIYCKQQLNTGRDEWDFKSHPDYTYMLEHVTFDQGQLYLNEIFSNYSHILDKNVLIEFCLENDKYGKPFKYKYNDFIECSPTSLRYILHTLHVLNHVYTDEIDIIEIGGGYGGLCLCINRLSKLFNKKINSYTIIDLPEPGSLQKLYLKDIPNVICSTIDNVKNLKYNSFFVSTYAFSEIDMKYQKEYTQKILNKYVNHGFVVWNIINVYDFIDNKKLTITKEIPNTGNEYNKYVYF